MPTILTSTNPRYAWYNVSVTATGTTGQIFDLWISDYIARFDTRTVTSTSFNATSTSNDTVWFGMLEDYREDRQVWTRTSMLTDQHLQVVIDPPRAWPPVGRPRRKAMSLFLRTLSPQQRDEWTAHRYFHCIGGYSGLRYRIRPFGIANVDAYDREGKITHRLCCHPQGVPDGDVLLTQKLYLESHLTEALFVATARRHPLPELRRQELRAA